MRYAAIPAALVLGAMLGNEPIDAQSSAAPMPAESGAQPTVTLAFQPGDGSPYSGNWDWRLMEGSPQFTSTLWTDNVLVGGDPQTGEEHRMLLNAREFVGNHPGQVPIGVQVLSATVSLQAGTAANVPIAVRRVTEDHLGEAGQLDGADLSNAPSWLHRSHGTPWATPGAGWPGSSELRPLDVRPVEVDYQRVEFDVRTAVQEWVQDPATNHGLLFAATDLSVPAQPFLGGGLIGSQRPIFTVTYAVKQDLRPPALSIDSPATTPVALAFVEGTNGPDAVELAIRVGDGPESPVRRTSPTRWYARVWMDVEGYQVPIEVLARDSSGNESSATQVLSWEATDLAATSAICVGPGEWLHLTASSSHPDLRWVEYDPGDGSAPVTLAADEASRAPVRYTVPGYYVATASLLDGAMQVLAQEDVLISVPRVSTPSAIAAMVGYLREVELQLEPSPAILSELSLVSSDSNRLVVEAVQEMPGGGSLRAARLDSDSAPVEVQVRLGGPKGRLIQELEVRGFTLFHDPVVNGEPSEFEFVMRIVPSSILERVPSLIFEVEVFSDSSTLPPEVDPDGDRVVLVPAQQFAADGSLTLPVQHDWDIGAEFCRTITAFDQVGGSGEQEGDPGEQGSPPRKGNGRSQKGQLNLKIVGPVNTVKDCEETYVAQVEGGIAPYNFYWITSTHPDGFAGSDTVQVKFNTYGDAYVICGVSDSSDPVLGAGAALKVFVHHEIEDVVKPEEGVPTPVSAWQIVTPFVHAQPPPGGIVELTVGKSFTVPLEFSASVKLDEEVLKVELPWAEGKTASAAIAVTYPLNIPVGKCGILKSRALVERFSGTYTKWKCGGTSSPETFEADLPLLGEVKPFIVDCPPE